MFDRLVRLLAVVSLLSSCGPASGALDASPADAAVADAPDAEVGDAGCTAAPGDLPGMRSIGPGALLPNLTFATATGSVSLVDFHVPCAPEAELLVVRSIAAWSGHARWHVAHGTGLDTHPARARLHTIDLLVENEDALPARASDLDAILPLYDAMPDVLAIDPEERFGGLGFGGTRLPVVLLIDARTLHVVRVLFAPHAGDVEDAIDRALATLDGRPPPPPRTPMLFDDRFTADEWDLVHGMATAPPPLDPSNAHAGDAGAAMLGEALFNDASLSPVALGCASCHQPGLGFADGRALGRGVGDLGRHTPTLYAASFARWPFWDGRVDSLWAQALGPIENAREMASSRLFVAHRVADAHAAAYEATFGPLPDLSDLGRFPDAGAPGDPAWEAMSAADQASVTHVFANVGKAIAAYERTIATPPSRFDDYLAGHLDALSATERDGLHEYLLEGCADCHWGPAMSDSAFHAIGMPGSGEGASLDRGRIAVLDTLVASPFRRQGIESDARGTLDPLAGLTSFDGAMEGAFRTPTLRGLSLTAPYGHAGTFATVRDVVRHYATIRSPRPADPHVAGTLDAHLVGFDDVPMRVDPLTAFLMTL